MHLQPLSSARRWLAEDDLRGPAAPPDRTRVWLVRMHGTFGGFRKMGAVVPRVQGEMWAAWNAETGEPLGYGYGGQPTADQPVRPAPPAGPTSPPTGEYP